MAFLQTQIYSDSLKRTVPINVILPSDKVDENGKRISKGPFKTLCLLHGIFGDHNDWVTGTRLIRWAMDHDLAVVMPSGENHFYLNQPGKGFDYSDFISNELVDLTREMFPLSDKPEDTFIGGLSMGGWGALYNGLSHPETFGGIAALSSAVVGEGMFPEDDYGEDLFSQKSFVEACSGQTKESVLQPELDLKTIIETNASKESLQKIYLACGTEDGLLFGSRILKDLFLANGYDLTYDEQAGGHDWDFWDMEIRKVIDWISPEKQAGISSGNIGKKS